MSISATVERSFNVLELLATRSGSFGVTEIGKTLLLPKSTVHRLLSDLEKLGYVLFDEDRKEYMLSFKLCQIGFKALSSYSIYEMAQPILNEIAILSGELVRLSLVQNNRLLFLAKAQEHSVGLRVDADMGNEAVLGYSASGLAWLSTLENESAWEQIQQQLSRVSLEGLSCEFIEGKHRFFMALDQVRSQKVAILENTMGIGTAAIAAPIFKNNQLTGKGVGVVSVAGPSIRFTNEKRQSIIPLLLEKVAELSYINSVSPLPSY